MTPDFMKLGDAFQIVIELAQSAALDPNDEDCDYLKEEALRQDLAIRTVEDWGTNNLDEDD